jgi:hypothetical protein
MGKSKNKFLKTEDLDRLYFENAGKLNILNDHKISHGLEMTHSKSE